jgi:hypothetical protein
MTKTKQTNVQYALVFKTDEDKSEAAVIAVDFGKIVSRKFNDKENVLYVNDRQLKEIKKHKELEYGFLTQNGNKTNNSGVELRR